MIKKLRQFTVNYPTLSAAICVFLALAVWHIDKWVFHVDFFMTVFHFSETTSETCKRIIAEVLLLLFIAYFLKNKLGEIFTFKNAKRGFLIATFFIVISIVVLVGSIVIRASAGAGHLASSPEEIQNLVEMIVACFFVGIFEETAYRVIPVQILRNKEMGSERKKLYYVLIFSSLFFALIHLVNFIGGYDTLAQCVTRMLSAFGFGMAMGAIYWVSGSIIPCMLTHFVWDTCQSGSEFYIQAKEATAASGAAGNGAGSIVVGFIVCVFWVCVAIFILRKKKYTGCHIAAKTIRQQSEEQR